MVLPAARSQPHFVVAVAGGREQKGPFKRVIWYRQSSPATKLFVGFFKARLRPQSTVPIAFNSINRENLPAAQDKEQLGSNEFLSKDKLSNRRDSIRCGAMLKASVISSETTPSPSSIESHSPISSFDSGETAPIMQRVQSPKETEDNDGRFAATRPKQRLGVEKAVPSGRSLLVIAKQNRCHPSRKEPDVNDRSTRPPRNAQSSNKVK